MSFDRIFMPHFTQFAGRGPSIAEYGNEKNGLSRIIDIWRAGP
jgi:hypothetical protein